MQMVPHHRLTNHFWEKETLLPRLPLLRREDTTRRHGHMHHNSIPHPWQPPDIIHRKEHIFLQEQNEYVPSRRASDVERVFPLKPVLHKRAYSLNNYQINSNVSNAEYQETFYSYLPRLTDVKQQQKSLKTAQEQRTGGRKTSDLESEHRGQMSSAKLSREIHSKEMMLQQKMFKAGDTLHRIQRERTARRAGGTRGERSERYSDKERREIGLYSDGYGPWNDGEDRYENERRDMERWEEWECKVNEREKDSRRQPLTSETAELKDKIQCDEYDSTAKGRRGKTLREMQDNTRRRRERRNVDEVINVRKEKYDRRKEDEEHERDMRKPGSSEWRRTDRSHLKQDRFTKETRYEPTSEVNVRRRRSAAKDEIPNPLQQVEENPDAPQQLMTCSLCQRSFLPDRLETHVKICEKKQPQRKIFDMSKHRAKGTDLEEFMKTNGRRKTPEEVKKRNWRQKHEAFIQIMRQGRAHETPSALNLNPDYISCPHCGRTFAPGPAERHIPKCQNIRSRPAPPKQLHNTNNRTR